MIDQLKILETLKCIKEICKNAGINGCKKCPFSDSLGLGKCIIINCAPVGWKINDESIWKAFLQ